VSHRGTATDRRLVADPVLGKGRVTSSSLPAGPAAVISSPAVRTARRRVRRVGRLVNRGLKPAGQHLEVYFTDPAREPDPARWRTDIVAFRAA